MRQSEKKEWLLRIGVFGSALAVGALGSYGIWQSFHDYGALLLFVLIFAVLLASLAYIVRKRKLGMLETT
jgi:hypothetical protein